jgi:hypothetical protein
MEFPSLIWIRFISDMARGDRMRQDGKSHRKRRPLAGKACKIPVTQQSLFNGGFYSSISQKHKQKPGISIGGTFPIPDFKSPEPSNVSTIIGLLITPKKTKYSRNKANNSRKCAKHHAPTGDNCEPTGHLTACTTKNSGRDEKSDGEKRSKVASPLRGLGCAHISSKGITQIKNSFRPSHQQFAQFASL